MASALRGVGTRFLGVTLGGPLNYTGIFMYGWFSLMVINRFRFIRGRDHLNFNTQDNPEFWFSRYQMIFPPSFLHNRLSAHYIEVNHIFAIEMMKRYQYARREILAEREPCTDLEKRQRYITNPNYVFESLNADPAGITKMKTSGNF
jgi:hypothetical protein